MHDIAEAVAVAKQSMVVLTESMFYVLMAFQKGEMCGIDIAEWIEKHTDGRVRIGPATLYTVLGKFEKEKYICEIRAEGRKRTYRITAKGLEAYDEELTRLRQRVMDAEALKEGKSHEKAV